MTVIVMSREELARLQVLIDVADKRLPIDDAVAPIGVTRRRACRLLDVFGQRGVEGLVSVRRGAGDNLLLELQSCILTTVARGRIYLVAVCARS